MGGIVSAMRQHPGAAWLVVACDMPWVAEATLQRLLARRDRTALATAYRSPLTGLPEPLCAVYEPTALAPLERAVEAGSMSLMRLLIASRVELVDSPDDRELTNA